ncbi:MAG TPA: N,N-dimethylformamidase beta subunit family domain-containing protein [Sphingobium sp.]
MQVENLSSRFDIVVEGKHQPIDMGSYGVVPKGPRRNPAQPCSWSILFCVLNFDDDQRPVLAEEGDQEGVVLMAGADGVSARVRTSSGWKSLSLSASLRPRIWYRVWLSIDPGSERVLLGLASESGATVPAVVQTVSDRFDALLPEYGSVFFAADGAGGRFNGKLEQPVILQSWIDHWDRPLDWVADTHPGLLALWDFSIGIDTQSISDRGPQRCDGALRNLPARGVRGVLWSGEEMNWSRAPTHYGAIRFADDMVGDCGWSSDFMFEIPADLPSGSYAFKLTCADGQDWLPFYVVPTTKTAARIAFLAPTFTYQIYANNARGNFDEPFRERVAAWDAYPYNPDDYPIYGASTYNQHPDGSGIMFSSRRRPMLTMRPGFLTFHDHRGSGLRHYPADSHILAWLEAQDFKFDIITDEELDERGAQALENYSVVITGSHPEYYTGAMLDGLQAHLEQGGRLIYTGGNGFYWRIARGSGTAQHAIEIRRAEGGVRRWASEPGEYYQSFDGRYGGLWRRNGRPPQQLVGIGFSAQGTFTAGWFRRTEASKNPDASWIFEGVDGDIFGDYGLSAGGAAGFELDRVDPALGTAREAIVVAQSEGIGDGFLPATEELLVSGMALSGEPIEDFLRGDMTYLPLSNGGAVFAAGSITFAGSLWQNGFDGPVSQILANVVTRFSDPASLIQN